MQFPRGCNQSTTARRSCSTILFSLRSNVEIGIAMADLATPIPRMRSWMTTNAAMRGTTYTRRIASSTLNAWMTWPTWEFAPLKVSVSLTRSSGLLSNVRYQRGTRGVVPNLRQWRRLVRLPGERQLRRPANLRQQRRKLPRFHPAMWPGHLRERWHRSRRSLREMRLPMWRRPRRGVVLRSRSGVEPCE